MAKPKRMMIEDVGAEDDSPRGEVPPDTVEDVSVVPLGAGRYRVETVLFARVPDSERVLERGATLPVARAAALRWRAHNGGLGRGLP